VSPGSRRQRSRRTNAARYQEGARTDIREPITWSGNGFFINWPAHLDLVLGNADGTGITVVPAAIRGTATQSAIVARVELSPDRPDRQSGAGDGPG
jgi:hypothetical protein